MSAAIIFFNISGRSRDLQRDQPRILRRSLRDSHNPFQSITEEHFMDLYRFSKTLVLSLLEELKPLLKTSSRMNALPSHIKILCALRFFATGSFQRSVGQDMFSSLSQTSVSRCVNEVAIALNRIAHRYVKFPNRADFAATKTKFFAEHGFPGVIGLIDGTHVKISAPKKEIEHVYYCRKGGHSKNVQIICDADYLILNANARFGGTAHDSYIWKSSKVQIKLQQLYNDGERDFWLLGDSGYPLQPWLMTPIGEAVSNAEELYNISHKKTRCHVERCIGVLKSRFRCLSKERVLFYAPKKAGTIIYACVVLHNILIGARLPLPEDIGQPETDIDEYTPTSSNVLCAGRRQRTQIVEQAFNN